MVIAQDSGNRYIETQVAVALANQEAAHGDPRAALDYSAVSIRHFHDAGGLIQMPLAVLVTIFDRLGCLEPAATIAGYAPQPVHRDDIARTRRRDRPPAGGPRQPDLQSACRFRCCDERDRGDDPRLRSNRPDPNRTRLASLIPLTSW